MSEQFVKVKDLNTNSKHVNLLAKVLSLSETKEVPSKYGSSTNRVAEAKIGDETGTIILTLWNDNIDLVKPDDVIIIKNGYVNVYRRTMRLNVGKYGSIEKSNSQIGEVNTSNDMSEKEVEGEYSGRRFGRGYKRRF
ncbi:MAG: OB-fold nucleic acid binding domain-containing protein [Crenarchaeota archaeon]|nr:OB-fold nucleic acid binding domain-containing protein [Thermoproteota archaeon]MDW8033688.1 OB-fold nucleic acid binding domain-containing protein [Nitrososphaerota archaeon]